jgi:uncharacterized protein YdaU (DUF1376 family)
VANEPWFKFWAVEYLCDGKVDKVPPEGRELLVRMWCICSQEGCVSADIEELARVTRLKTQYVSQYVSHCVSFFELRCEMYYSLRMEKEKKKSEAARNSAEARYNSESYKKDAAKRTAERTAKKARKQEGQKKELKQEQNPSPQKSIEALFELPPWLDLEAWEAYREMRKKIKKPMTDRARDQLLKRLAAMHARGVDVTAALDQSILKCYTDVYETKDTQLPVLTMPGKRYKTTDESMRQMGITE